MYHTEVRWLSKENVQKQIFKPWIELTNVLAKQKMGNVVKLLHNDVVSRTYLVDIFADWMN